jgi:hypothetical protein
LQWHRCPLTVEVPGSFLIIFDPCVKHAPHEILQIPCHQVILHVLTTMFSHEASPHFIILYPLSQTVMIQ